jgi:hypothetical protein
VLEPAELSVGTGAIDVRPRAGAPG